MMIQRSGSLLTLVLVASCSSAGSATPTTIPQPTSTLTPRLETTVTTVPPTLSATPQPTLAPTNTPVPCDPRVADFCVTDGHFVLRRPIQPPANDSVERTYSYASTANGTRDPHHGVELENELGTSVLAAADGVVLYAGPDETAIYSPWRDYYGNLVVLEHENGLFTLYAHLSMLGVEAGASVMEGEKIGEVGRTGVAIGSHLHFEVRRGDVENHFSTVNPELWLNPPQGSGVISLSIIDTESKFQRAAVTIQHYSSFNEVLDVFYLNTYHPSLATGEENAAIGGLPAGSYRISLSTNGGFYERWVEVESGKLTQVLIVVK